MIRISAFADEISQDPVEQIDVLTGHGIKAIEFRAIHGTNVLDLSRRPARRVPRAARRARVPAQRDRLADRQDPDHRAVRASISSGSSGPWTSPTSTRPRGSASSASTCRPGDDPAIASRGGDRPHGRAGPPRGRSRDHPVPREREGDLRRHRGPRRRRPRDGRFARRCGTRSTRPITSRSGSRSTRPGPGCGTSSATSTSRITTRSSSATCRPAPATA